MADTLKQFYHRWSRMPVGPYIIWANIIGLLIAMPFAALLAVFDADLSNIGGPESMIEDLGKWTFIVLAVIIAPIMETAMAQYLPITLVQKYRPGVHKLVPLMISACLFSGLHFYSIYYIVLIFPMGLILAECYLNFLDRPESSFWVTTAVHAFRNGMVSIPLIFS